MDEDDDELLALLDDEYARAILVAIVVDLLGAGDGIVLLARSTVTYAGLCAVLYALVYE